MKVHEAENSGLLSVRWNGDKRVYEEVRWQDVLNDVRDIRRWNSGCTVDFPEVITPAEIIDNVGEILLRRKTETP